MSKLLNQLTPELTDFIRSQNIFFTGTAGPEGRVNVSPKGLDTLRVLAPDQVLWENLTGSGNETAAHLRLSNRMTLMFCAFEGDPLILRLYGTAWVFHPRDDEFDRYAEHFKPTPGARQIIVLDIDLVQTSCGFAVPYMEFRGDREILTQWAEKKGTKGIQKYWEEKNRKSIDGFDTHIFED